MPKNDTVTVLLAPEDKLPNLPAREYLPPAKPSKDPIIRYFGTASLEVDPKQDVNNLLTKITHLMSELLPRLHAVEAGRPDPVNGNWQTDGYTVKELKRIVCKLAELLPAAMEVFMFPTKPAKKVEED